MNKLKRMCFASLSWLVLGTALTFLVFTAWGGLRHVAERSLVPWRGGPCGSITQLFARPGGLIGYVSGILGQ